MGKISLNLMTDLNRDGTVNRIDSYIAQGGKDTNSDGKIDESDLQSTSDESIYSRETLKTQGYTDVNMDGKVDIGDKIFKDLYGDLGYDQLKSGMLRQDFSTTYNKVINNLSGTVTESADADKLSLLKTALEQLDYAQKQAAITPSVSTSGDINATPYELQLNGNDNVTAEANLFNNFELTFLVKQGAFELVKKSDTVVPITPPVVQPPVTTEPTVVIVPPVVQPPVAEEPPVVVTPPVVEPPVAEEPPVVVTPPVVEPPVAEEPPVVVTPPVVEPPVTEEPPVVVTPPVVEPPVTEEPPVVVTPPVVEPPVTEEPPVVVTPPVVNPPADDTTNPGTDPVAPPEGKNFKNWHKFWNAFKHFVKKYGHHKHEDKKVEEPVKKPTSVTVEKVFSEAGYKNTLMVVNKETGEAKPVFSNSTDTKKGSSVTVTLDVADKNNIELVLLPDAWRNNVVKSSVESYLGGSGKFLLNGNSLSYINKCGRKTDINVNVYHSQGVSADGLDHCKENGNQLGFEDLWKGGDKDYDDLVVNVNIK